jgi:hypothetical protein
LCLLYEKSILQRHSQSINQTLENQPTPTQVDKMAEIQAEIDEVKADIEAIKNANKKWASDAGVLAAIAAMNNRIAGLEARLAPGKLPIIFTLHFNI